jgi:hypothetical protein
MARRRTMHKFACVSSGIHMKRVSHGLVMHSRPRRLDLGVGPTKQTGVCQRLDWARRDYDLED